MKPHDNILCKKHCNTMQCKSAPWNVQMTLPFCSQKEKRDENAMSADLLSWDVMDEMRAGAAAGGGEELGEENDENTQRLMKPNKARDH